jgi:hypothetical protein
VTRGQKVATVLLWILAAAVAVRLGRIAARASVQPTSGFAAYHAAARLLMEGRLDGAVYRDEVFQVEVERLAPGVRDILRPNPPSVGLLLAPLAAAPHLTTRALFIVVGLAALGLAVFLLTRCTGLEGPVAAAFAAFTFVSPPVVENVRNGQAYSGLLALAAIALAAARRDSAPREGVCLGLAAGLKLALPFVWLAAAVGRRRASLGWASATVTALGAVTVVFTGPGAFVEWARLAVRVGGRPELAVAAYQSQAGLLARLFRGDPRWNPEPILAAPALGAALTLAAFALAVAVVVHVARRDVGAGYAAAVAASLAASPLSLEYHYVLALLPVSVLGARAVGRRALPEGLLVAASLVLLAVPLVRTQGAASAGEILFAYPRLVAAWLLAVASVLTVRRAIAGTAGGTDTPEAPTAQRRSQSSQG